MDRNIVRPRSVKLSASRNGLERLKHDPKLGGSGVQQDKWYEQLVKYIPAESLSLYLAIEGVIKSAQFDSQEQRIWLGLALLISLVFTWVYLRRVWKIQRLSQVAISTT